MPTVQTLKSGRTVKTGPVPVPDAGPIASTRFSTPELDRTLARLAERRTARTAPELVGPDDADWPTLARGNGRTLAPLAPLARTYDPGTGPLAPADWHRTRPAPAPAPTDTAGRTAPASAPRRERDNSLSAMLARAGRPERTVGRRDDAEPLAPYPLAPDTAAAIVADWHGADTGTLLTVLATVLADPTAPVPTADGRPTLARDYVDPIRHLLARQVRAVVGYSDPLPRIPRQYDRMARRNGSARRSSVAVVG